MALDETIQSLWRSQQAGNPFPDEWKGKLSLEEAYRVQQAVLRRKMAEQGAVQAGWKVGLTADAVRKMYKAQAPVFGYLLQADGYPSEHTFSFGALRSPGVESEVLVILGRDLKGPGVTPEQARAAVAAVAPAFEIIERRGGDLTTDFFLGVADNVAQRAYVVGKEQPLPADLDLGEITVEVVINGQTREKVLGKAVMDPPLRSLAWLANAAAPYGGVLRAGQRMLTGSFTKPIPASQGDTFESRFTRLGSVRATFV